MASRGHDPVATVAAVVNQKGGVAKTTTVVTLGAAFAELGARVLLVDLDPQASLTFSVGLEPDAVELGIHEALIGDRTVSQITHRVSLPARCTGRLDVVPATQELTGTEATLTTMGERELALRRALSVPARDYDAVLIDCSPTLGLLTINALAAADEVLVPVSCDMLSHRGVGQLLDTVDDVQRLLNPKLNIAGLLPTMFDKRLAHARAVVEDLPARFGVPVLTPIPRSVKFAEAPALGRTVLQTSPRSAGSTAYRAVAADLAATWGVAERAKRRQKA